MKISIKEKIADTTKIEVALAVPVITPPAPYISDKGTWMVYDNSTHSYTDTGITAVGKDADIAAAEAATAAANTAAGNANTAAAAIDDRATALETGKADLDAEKKYVRSGQIDPLQGEQTGAETENGYFKSTDSRLIFSGDRTISILFTMPEAVPTGASFLYLFTDEVTRRGRSLFVSPNGKCYAAAHAVANYGIELMTLDSSNFGTLHHLVMSEKNNVTSVYFDGAYRGNIQAQEYYPPTCLCVGKGNEISLKNWNGKINQVRLFNYALPESEVLALWNLGKPGEYMLPSKATTAVQGNLISAGQPNNPFTWTGVSSEYYQKIYLIRNLTKGKRYRVKVRVSNFLSGNPFFMLGTSADGNTEFTIPPVNGDHIIDINTAKPSDSACITIYGGINQSDRRLTIEILSIEQIGCIAEYLSCGLLPDKWRDTSGNGIDLPATGTPELSYECIPDLNEIIVDTGVFYTNIASGTASKSMSVPAGYAVDQVIVRSLNEGNLTGITVMNGYSNRSYMKNASIVPTGGRDTIVSACISIEENTLSGIYPQVYISSKTTPVTVNATGNSTAGGMQVKLICKWIG